MTNKQKWIIALIAVAVVVGVIAAVKLMPMYATLACVASFVLGWIGGYNSKRPEIKEIPVEKIVEKIIEVPAKQSKVSAKKPSKKE